jgi:hypothetical protein
MWRGSHVAWLACGVARMGRGSHGAWVAAVLYKTLAEIHLLAQDYVGGEAVLHEAMRCFKLVKDFDCTSLIEGCQMLLGIAEANKPKQAGAQPPGTQGRAGGDGQGGKAVAIQ